MNKKLILILILTVFISVLFFCSEKVFQVEDEYNRLKINETDTAYEVSAKVSRYLEIKNKMDEQIYKRSEKGVKDLSNTDTAGGIITGIFTLLGGGVTGLIFVGIFVGAEYGINTNWNKDVLSKEKYKELIEKYNIALKKDIESMNRVIIVKENGKIVIKKFVK